ncbi:MAG: helix-turn-helix transcriptional regulator, partial [Acidimicrobiales bacterium]
FRVDRIESIVELERPATVRPDDAEEGRGIFHPQESDPRITLDLEPEASWVVDSFPCEDVSELADGRLRATLVVTAIPWMERLLVRLGRLAVVVDASGLPEADRLAEKAAGRILARYR